MNQDMKVVTVEARAIDVGYFNVKYTKGRKEIGNSVELKVDMFPSIAPRLAATELVHATGAPKSDTCTVNVNGVNYVVGKGVLSYTSGDEPRPVDPAYCLSDKYHALMLGAMYYMADAENAGHEFVIESLVLGLPLNTYGQYHQELARHATGEHTIGKTGAGVVRRVTVKEAVVMVQPHGAMLNFGVSSKVEGSTLVVDPGGGTLDWFMVDANKNIVWTRSGAYPKAMLHCALAVADSIKSGLRNQIDVMNTIDEALRTRAEEFRIGPTPYKLADFLSQVDSVLDQSVKTMLARTGPLDGVRRILLTGGGANVFREYLERNRPELTPALEMDRDPVYSNLRGFQIRAEYQYRARSGR